MKDIYVLLIIILIFIGVVFGVSSDIRELRKCKKQGFEFVDRDYNSPCHRCYKVTEISNSTELYEYGSCLNKRKR